eukprot:1565105-Rhodomonas_salina.1
MKRPLVSSSSHSVSRVTSGHQSACLHPNPASASTSCPRQPRHLGPFISRDVVKEEARWSRRRGREVRGWRGAIGREGEEEVDGGEEERMRRVGLGGERKRMRRDSAAGEEKTR